MMTEFVPFAQTREFVTVSVASSAEGIKSAPVDHEWHESAEINPYSPAGENPA